MLRNLSYWRRKFCGCVLVSCPKTLFLQWYHPTRPKMPPTPDSSYSLIPAHIAAMSSARNHRNLLRRKGCTFFQSHSQRIMSLKRLLRRPFSAITQKPQSFFSGFQVRTKSSRVFDITKALWWDPPLPPAWSSSPAVSYVSVKQGIFSKMRPIFEIVTSWEDNIWYSSTLLLYNSIDSALLNCSRRPTTLLSLSFHRQWSL